MLSAPVLAVLPGQGGKQIAYLALAFVLSALIGLEREWRQKSAGLRTHTLVGVGSALFLLVSKYGFFEVPGSNVSLDPSRVAAQIVSGIGFIGGGLIFVRGDIVRGLTTAAIVWVTAAIGMACGAGLWILAVVVTAGHFIVVLGFTELSDRLPRSGDSGLRVVYDDGRGILRQVLAACGERGFAVTSFDTHHQSGGTVAVTLELQGRAPLYDLAAELDELDGVREVASSETTD
jgi:putative Mg2+ transporter-C (MgtC) family protein